MDEPELLLWVHCAETWSFLSVLRRAGFPLTDAQADRYLDEQRCSATLVGLRADEVPGSRAEMIRYFADIRPELAHTAESDVIYRFPHRPPVPMALRWGTARLHRADRTSGVLAASRLGAAAARPGRLSGPGDHVDVAHDPARRTVRADPVAVGQTGTVRAGGHRAARPVSHAVRAATANLLTVHSRRPFRGRLP